MNEKEIAEVRRALSPERNAVTSIKGCYINSDGRIIAEFEKSVALMEEQETARYIAVFKRVLSGGLGKNLIDLPFSNEQVSSGEEYRRLTRLKNAGLENKEDLHGFFEAIAPAAKSEDNRVILMLCNRYDVLKRTKDGMEGDSGEVYTHLLLAVCPVKAGKKGLSYDPACKTFFESGGEGLIGAPEAGLLFPAFDGRQTNIYNALFYTRDTDCFPESLIETLCGKVPLPLPAAEQSRAFKTVVAEALDKACTLETLKNIHRSVAEKIEIHKETRDPEPLLFDKEEIGQILRDSGLPEEKREEFSKSFNEAFGMTADLPPKNLIDPKKIELRTADVIIKVSPGHEDLIETRVIDGRKYILVRAESDAEFNGVSVVIG